MSTDKNFGVFADVAARLLTDTVLFGAGVTAGRGRVVDWRSVKCGENVVADADAYDTAAAFVDAVGVEEARHALERAQVREFAAFDAAFAMCPFPPLE